MITFFLFGLGAYLVMKVLTYDPDRKVNSNVITPAQLAAEKRGDVMYLEANGHVAEVRKVCNCGCCRTR